MFVFLPFLALSGESQVTLESENELQAKYQKIQGQLGSLEKLKNEVLSLKALRSGSASHIYGDETKPIYLAEVDKKRTVEYENSLLFSFGATDFDTAVNSRAPILTYKLLSKSKGQRTFCSQIRVGFASKSTANIRQFVLTFRNVVDDTNTVTYRTRPIDLPNTLEPKTIDFETEIEFTDIVVDVLLNWGNSLHTNIPQIDVVGPVHDSKE